MNNNAGVVIDEGPAAADRYGVLIKVGVLKTGDRRIAFNNQRLPLVQGIFACKTIRAY